MTQTVPSRTLALFATLLALPAGAQTDTASARRADSTRATLLQATVVTATRSPQVLENVPVSAVVLDRPLLTSNVSKSVSDALRMVPGFTLRNYQNSLNSHPSTHAPAMRGLTGSSSSRVLVLLDGVPLNDPFASWVYWSRVPLPLVQRAEVVRGGGSGVWGDRALGGVINLMTADPRRQDLQLSLSGGDHGTTRTAGIATLGSGKARLQLAGDYTDTDGYVVVRPDLRGPIDTPAGSRGLVGYAKLRYDISPLMMAYVSGNILDEKRDNATPLRKNTTETHELRTGMQWVTGGGSRFSAHAFANDLTHDHYFTSEAIDRRTETPSLDQLIEARAMGAQIGWSRQVLARHQLSAGVDLSVIEGEVEEDQSYINGAFTRKRLVDGKQSSGGAYLQDLVELGRRTHLMASIRVDTRTTHDARRLERDIVNNRDLLDSTYADLTDSRLSHNLGVRIQASPALALRLASYSAFRSPTLNELFKPFREAGNVITEANPSLATERLHGLEAGVDFTAGRAQARITAFHTRVHDPIFELTVATAGTTARTIAPCGFVPAGGTCRQRRNVDLMRSHGVEAELDLPLTDALTVRASWIYNPTRVLRAELQPELVGKQTRANARHGYTVSAFLDRPSLANLVLTVRSAGRRFEDDLNQLALASFVVADVHASRALVAGTQVFLGVENLFDAEYPISRANNGLVRVGSPRMIEGGFRYHW
jgi:outer membrane receptor protein involved in Fe transport